MRRNQFNASSFKFFIQRIAVISTVAYQPCDFCFCKALLYGWLHQCTFKRRGAKDLHSQRPALFRYDGHQLRTLAPLGFAYTVAPFLAEAKLASTTSTSFGFRLPA